MTNLFDLSGRVALVTGASGGLGVAIADAFASQGARLVLTDRDRERTEAMAARLRARGQVAHAVAADLGDPMAVDALVDAALAEAGRIDVLVCNAGVQGPAGPIGQTREVDWQHVMAINLHGALRLTSRVIPGMAERGDGSVILMSSIAGLRGNRAIGLYGLSKAALAQLARNLAVEWGPHGVRVNAISPGLIRTALGGRPARRRRVHAAASRADAAAARRRTT